MAYRQIFLETRLVNPSCSALVWTEKDTSTFLKVMVSASKGELRKEQIISCDCQVVREKGSQSHARILLGVTPVMLNVAIHPLVDPRLSRAVAFLYSTGFVTAAGTLLKIGETAITPVEAKASARVCLITTRSSDEDVRAALVARGVPPVDILSVSQSTSGSTGVVTRTHAPKRCC